MIYNRILNLGTRWFLLHLLLWTISREIKIGGALEKFLGARASLEKEKENLFYNVF